MVIAHNINAINAQRQYNVTTQNQKKATEKLSSGYRINRAADDAAGLSISEKMRRLIRGLDRGADNISEGISLVQTADGALEEVIENLQRIRELSIAAYNETNSESDIAAMQAEVDQALTEIGRIGETTTFNGKQILQGTKTVYAGKTPDTIETYDEVTYLHRKVPSWLMSSDKMEYRQELDGYAPGTNDGIMYTINDKNEQVYYGKEIMPPEKPFNEAKYSQVDWDDNLKNNASAYLDFSGLTAITKAEELFTAMTGLLGVNINYPCGTCHDDRCGVHFTGKLEGLPYTIPEMSEVTSGTDRIGQVDLTGNAFKFQITRGGVTSDFETTGYFEAIMKLVELQTDPSLTDLQKETETVSLAKTIAEDLTTRTLNTLDTASQGHFDRVIRNKSNEKYSLIIYDYRDREQLTDPQKAMSQMISSVDGLLAVHEEKTRVIEGEDYYAQEGITIVPGTEYAKSIELTLPKVTLEELGISGYRVGTQYDTHISYKYGARAEKKLAEAKIQYEKDMEIYKKELKEYNKEYTAWKNSGYTVTTYKEVPDVEFVSLLVDGHPKTICRDLGVKQVPVNSTVYPTDPPVEPEKPREPVLSDFSAYADMIVTKTLREDTLDPIDNALAKVLAARSILGAEQNRLEHAYNINKNTEENEQAAESRIRDTDMSEEMVNYSKNSILVQAGQAMIAQTNQQPQEVLQLLQ